jgi:4-amino-4-deoxy-L-arabinose transferase-like glycosyltransferase
MRTSSRGIDGAPLAQTRVVEMSQPARPEWSVIALILLTVAVAKALYLLHYWYGLPFAYGPVGDSVVYEVQARSVRGGRFGHASLLAFSPLYGYFVAAIDGARHFERVVWIQYLLGLLNVFLVYRVTKRRVGVTAANTAALLLGTYGFTVFLESKLLSDTLGLALAMGAMAIWLGPGFDRGSSQSALAAGSLAALAVLARSSLVFGAPFLVVAAMLPWSSGNGLGLLQRLRRGALVALAMLLVFGSYGLWTSRHAGVFVPITYQSPQSASVLRASSAKWDERFDSVRIDSDKPFASALDVVNAVQQDLDRVRAEDESVAGPSLVETWRELDLASIARAAPGKLLAGLSDYEKLYQYGYYGERSVIPALQVFPTTFGILLLLGGIGAVALARRKGPWALVPYLPWFVGALTTLALYHPSSRYRLVMILPLSMLAGYAVAIAIEEIRERRHVIAWAGVALCCGFLTLRSAGYELRHPASWEATVAESYFSTGDVERMHEHLDLAMALAPDDPTLRARVSFLRGKAPRPPR